MENIGITRQKVSHSPPSGANSFSVHTYPFKTLPLLQSHIQPHFAIAALGMLLHNQGTVPQTRLNELIAMYPSVRKIFRLYVTWKIAANSQENLEVCLKNKTYAPPAEDGSEVDELASESDGDSDCTVPRRIKEKRLRGRSQRLTKRSRATQTDNCGSTTMRGLDYENGVEPD